MVRRLISTHHDYGLLVIRLALAAVLLAHGLQKAFGLFGGYGFAATVGFFTNTLGVPAPLAVLVILAETAGAVDLAAGLLGRVAALGGAAVMAGAVAMVHYRFGFFMNWSGTQGGEGFDLHLLAFAIALAVMICGSGALSLDRLLQRRLASAPRDEAVPSARPVVA